MTCPKCKKQIARPAKNKTEWLRFIKMNMCWLCPQCGYGEQDQSVWFEAKGLEAQTVDIGKTFDSDGNHRKNRQGDFVMYLREGEK